MMTLICGLPNAGKTTYSGQFGNVIHMDEEKKLSSVCEKVAKMEDVVVEGVFGKRAQRARVMDAYRGGIRKCVFIDITIDECIGREDRNRPEFILRNAYRLFEPPTLEEGWDELEVIR